MTKGFADQPIGGGIIQRLNSKNTDMTANSIGFSPAPLFANANGDIFSPIEGKVFANASGHRNFDFGNLFGTGLSGQYLLDNALKIYNENQEAQRRASANNDAITLEKLKIEQAKIELAILEAKTKLEKEEAAGKTNYTIPILVTGGVIILGIGAYFIFRQVKIK
jgi:hypothetical protein